MPDKSYVAMEQNICKVCTKQFDTGTILLDRRMKQSMDRYTTTGWGLCPDCQKLWDDGYVALISADANKSVPPTGGKIVLEGVYRTGEIVHLKIEAFKIIFPNIEVKPVMITDLEVISKIKELITSSVETK